MSTASVRRIKERGGGGGKITAVPVPGKVSPVSGRSVSVGKENSRPTSRVRAATTQKPALKPMARVDKSAAAAVAPSAEEARSRRSTSSVPRGRSSSPSDFTRALSDMRKNPSRPNLGSIRGKENGASLKDLNGKPNEKSDFEKRVRKDLPKNGGFLGGMEGGFQKEDKVKIRVMNDKRSDNKEEILGSVLVEIANLEKKNGLISAEEAERKFQENEKMKKSVLEEVSSKSGVEAGLRSSKFTDELKVKSCAVGALPGSTSRESKVAIRVSTAPSGAAANKYPSKLHEKLAFLEGKVKRIASDIKRTKDMLDLNNPNASKLILSDIQEKITGIEKAMVYVAGSDGDSRIGFVKSVERSGAEKEEKKGKDAQCTAKGLNAEELEARLFPHHKLIRDRTLSKSTVKGPESRASEVGESKDTVIMDEKAIIFEDGANAEELLTALSKEESQVVEEASEMDDSKTYMGESSSSNSRKDKANVDAFLMADEKLNDFDDEERVPDMAFEEEVEEDSTYKLNDIGRKTSTGGWFVSEGESVLLAHDDGYCSFYDISNSEVQS